MSVLHGSKQLLSQIWNCLRTTCMLCEQHWPPSYPIISKKSRIRQIDPPSVWPASLPPSCIPKLPPKPLPTKRTSFVIHKWVNSEN